MTAATLPSIRRNHERRATQADVETLDRHAHGLLDAFGVARGSSWVSRQVRSYCAGSQRIPFNPWFVARLRLNAAERARVEAINPSMLAYADPTGEEAVRRAMRGE